MTTPSKPSPWSATRFWSGGLTRAARAWLAQAAGRLAVALSLSSALLGQAASPGQAPGVGNYARLLAGKLVARAATLSAVSLSLNNRSSLLPQQAEAVRAAIEQQLRAAGVDMVEARRALSDVRLTISDNAQGQLWVAEVRYGAASDVEMIEVPRNISAAPAPAGAVELVTEPLCTSTGVVLDASPLDTPAPAAPLAAAALERRVLVLTTAGLQVYGERAGRCELRQSTPIELRSPWPRDPRGRVLVTPGYGFELFLPGLRCTGVAVPLLNVQCLASDAAWPIGDAHAPLRASYVATANHFDGKLFSVANGAVVSTVPPFFTAAYVVQGDGATWWFAGTDGRARAYSPVNSATVDIWGSDVAALASDCDRATRLLVTRAQPRPGDSVRLYEMRAGKPWDTGATVDLNGPVTALWSAADGHSATVVVRENTGFGASYAAYSLSVRCRH